MKQGGWVSPVGGGCLMSVLVILGWRVYKNNFRRSSQRDPSPFWCDDLLHLTRLQERASNRDWSLISSYDRFLCTALFSHLFIPFVLTLVDVGFFPERWNGSRGLIQLRFYIGCIVSFMITRFHISINIMVYPVVLRWFFSFLYMSFMRPPYTSFLLNISIFR